MDDYMDVSRDGFAGRIEVIEGRSGRRRWSNEEKARIASECFRPGVQVADVARRHGTTRWQIYDWRKRLVKGLLVAPAEARTPPAFAAVVVEPEERRPAMVSPSSDGIIDLCVDGITIRAGADRLRGASGPAGSAMIAPNGQLRVFMATRPVDLPKKAWMAWLWRLGRSSGLIRSAGRPLAMVLEPVAHHGSIFRSKRADRVKILVWDRTGLVLVHKRLEGAKFVWPRVQDGVPTLSPAQFSALFEG